MEPSQLLPFTQHTREGLDIDTPFLIIEVEGFKSTLLAQALRLINKFVSTIISKIPMLGQSFCYI